MKRFFGFTGTRSFVADATQDDKTDCHPGPRSGILNQVQDDKGRAQDDRGKI